jgi:hypothetical protein
MNYQSLTRLSLCLFGLSITACGPTSSSTPKSTATIPSTLNPQRPGNSQVITPQIPVSVQLLLRANPPQATPRSESKPISLSEDQLKELKRQRILELSLRLRELPVAAAGLIRFETDTRKWESEEIDSLKVILRQGSETNQWFITIENDQMLDALSELVIVLTLNERSS